MTRKRDLLNRLADVEDERQRLRGEHLALREHMGSLTIDRQITALTDFARRARANTIHKAYLLDELGRRTDARAMREVQRAYDLKDEGYFRALASLKDALGTKEAITDLADAFHTQGPII